MLKRRLKLFRKKLVFWFWVKSRWTAISRHNSLVLGLPILAGCLIIILVFGEETKAVDRWIEFWGLTFDVAVILIAVEFFRELREQKNEISRHRDTIQDYKCWNSDEAGYRIGGALRRLARLGVVQFDFSGWRIEVFSFSHNEIASIKGSTFYNKHGMGFHKPPKANLEDVDFGGVDCRDVVFSGHIFANFTSPAGRGIVISNCSFQEVDLRGASFAHAKMIWSDEPSEDQYEIIDENPDGSPAYAQTECSPFYGANVSGASFTNVAFENADFRDVENIEDAIFEGASGLDSCFFDSAEIKRSVLSKI